MKPAEILFIYHANCADGFTAAWLANRKWGVHAEYLPMQHGQEFDYALCTDRAVFIVDFSFNLEKTAQIVLVARSVTALDHHKTAIEALGNDEAVIAACEAIGADPAKLKLTLDPDKSGGHLMYRNFFGPIDGPNPAPWLVSYTEDRDLWRWKLPNSREINAALRSYPMTFEMWDKLALVNQARSLVTEGTFILRSQAEIVQRQCANAISIPIDGHEVPCVNCTALLSETLEKLAEGQPFAAGWYEDSNGGKRWSLRSDKNGLDVAEIAQKFGGGGHRHAAGFSEVGTHE